MVHTTFQKVGTRQDTFKMMGFITWMTNPFLDARPNEKSLFKRLPGNTCHVGIIKYHTGRAT